MITYRESNTVRPKPPHKNRTFRFHTQVKPNQRLSTRFQERKPICPPTIIHNATQVTSNLTRLGMAILSSNLLLRSRPFSTRVSRSIASTMSLPRYNLLIDLNGTCHIADTPTPGAIAAVQKLRAAQKQNPDGLHIRFCSNTSKESSQSLLSRLRRVGFGPELISSHDVFTSLDAAHRYVARRQLRPLLLLSQSAQSVFREDQDVAQSCFFPHAEMDPNKLSSDDQHRLRSCNAVVIGLCPGLMTQRWLDEAFRLLSGEYGSSEQVALIATHRGRFRPCPKLKRLFPLLTRTHPPASYPALYHRPSEDVALSMGPGAFVAALEAASHRQASTTTVCGKPSQAFLQECVAGMIPENEAMSSYTNIIVSRSVPSTG